MKKQLLNLSALCLALAFGGSVVAQNDYVQPTADVNKTAATITIDGSASDWAGVTGIVIDKPYQAETPTLNSATWKAVWNDDGIYVIVEVDDDVWSPSWISGAADWQSDKIEVYFDVSSPQRDGLGGSAGLGNYQFGANYSETTPGEEIAGFAPGTQWPAAGILYASTYDGNGISCMEYFSPWSDLLDQDGVAFVPGADVVMGFDVCVVDNDVTPAVRNRAVWSNIGAAAPAGAGNESWNNCDDVGLITLKEVGISEKAANTNILVSNMVTNEIVFNTVVTNVKVMNTMGQVVKSNSNVSDLANGVYIVTATTSKGVVANRFVKQ